MVRLCHEATTAAKSGYGGRARSGMPLPCTPDHATWPALGVERNQTFGAAGLFIAFRVPPLRYADDGGDARDDAKEPAT